MSRFNFYTREDIDAFIDAFYGDSRLNMEIVTIEADPVTHRLLWQVTIREVKKDPVLPPAGESVL